MDSPENQVFEPTIEEQRKQYETSLKFEGITELRKVLETISTIGYSREMFKLKKTTLNKINEIIESL